MKRCSFSVALIILFFIMLFFPKEVFDGASSGLLLWFQIVLPTLLPFMILSNLLIYTNSFSYIVRLLGGALRNCFHSSVNGSFAILTGFLCGYPMGAKVTSDLMLTRQITKKEAGYLLSFCNNTSPVFIISYIICQNFKDEELILPSMLILFLSPILCSFIFRIYYHISSDTLLTPQQSASSAPHFQFQILDECMMNAFETITKVGGYIMLFSVLLSLFELFPLRHLTFFKILLPMLEITNGIPMILQDTVSRSHAYVCAMTLASFGGLCSVAQTNSIIQEAGLSIVPYIIEKLITALVTSLFASLYVMLIPL